MGLASLPETKPVEQHAANRKCPKCAERDFRACDRQRTRPDDYRSRAYRVKWLCLACGYRETEDLEEA
jgi:C4-type Zn-finger protein